MQVHSPDNKDAKESWILTLDNVFNAGTLADYFKKILKSLEEIYDYPVEIEFTLNFTDNNKFKINLLQCRPLQTKGLGHKVNMPVTIDKENILFASSGYFLGGNISQEIKRIIYIDPQKYSRLILSDKYEIARIVGRLNIEIKNRDKTPTLLMGPGRWGTTTPSLGVPVRFAEINNITALGEIAFSEGNLIPELSFGTHFFQDLVETNIFYVAIFPERKDTVFNNGWLKQLKNLFTELLPQSLKFKDIIGVYDTSNKALKIMSSVVSQKVICFYAKDEKA
jgi:hypothetical protein